MRMPSGWIRLERVMWILVLRDRENWRDLALRAVKRLEESRVDGAGDLVKESEELGQRMAWAEEELSVKD